jgi:small subunit ribosomal protein S2
MSAVVTMKQLLEAGVHFGHQTRRWNPKMKSFIFQERNGIYILDLQQTLKRLLEAHSYIAQVVRGGGKVMFIGTKKQASDSVKEEATRCGQYYINQRWLGGLLTNYATIKTRIDRLAKLEDMEAQGEFEKMSKKEAKTYRTELQKLQKYLGGVRGMNALPDAMIIIDLRKEQNAFTEAKKSGIPVVALVDTNCDPTGVNYPVPGNDDAIRAVRLVCRVLADAVEMGQKAATLTEEDFMREMRASRGEDVSREREREAAAAPAETEQEAPKRRESRDDLEKEIDRESQDVFKGE